MSSLTTRIIACAFHVCLLFSLRSTTIDLRASSHFASFLFPPPPYYHCGHDVIAFLLFARLLRYSFALRRH